MRKCDGWIIPFPAQKNQLPHPKTQTRLPFSLLSHPCVQAISSGIIRSRRIWSLRERSLARRLTRTELVQTIELGKYRRSFLCYDLSDKHVVTRGDGVERIWWQPKFFTNVLERVSRGLSPSPFWASVWIFPHWDWVRCLVNMSMVQNIIWRWQIFYSHLNLAEWWPCVSLTLAAGRGLSLNIPCKGAKPPFAQNWIIAAESAVLAPSWFHIINLRLFLQWRSYFLFIIQRVNIIEKRNTIMNESGRLHSPDVSQDLRHLGRRFHFGLVCNCADCWFTSVRH